jgi:hypothetical protein
MINRPINLTPKLKDLVDDTIRIVLEDSLITEREMPYLRKLYKAIYDVEATDTTIVKDLKELGGWTIKNVSK